jgi:CrcB protein
MVCFGGAVGTGARYLLSSWMVKAFGSSFPYGTLAVNIIGSLLLAALLSAGTEGSTMSPTLRLALTTGVLGGFTTYSTFSYETLEHLHEGAPWVALAYISATVIGCLLASVIGWIGVRWLLAG